VYSREQISSELSDKLSEILVTLIEIFALSTKTIKGGRLLKFTRNVLLGNDDKIQASIGKLDQLTKTEASLVGAETLTESKRTGRVVDEMSVTVTSTNVTVQETGQTVGQMSLEVTEVRETLGDVLLKVSELRKEAKDDQEKNSAHNDSFGTFTSSHHHSGKECHLNRQGGHSASRTGKKNCACHYRSRNSGDGSLYSMGVARETEHQWNRHQHFHEPGEVVVINVRTINPTTQMSFAEPVDFSIRGKALD